MGSNIYIKGKSIEINPTSIYYHAENGVTELHWEFSREVEEDRLVLVNDRLKKEKVKTDEFCIKLWYSSKTESFRGRLKRIGWCW